MTIELFRRFPALAERIPHIGLVRRPTPLESFEVAGHRIAVKRDDLSGEAYGGNKVRKLEFLLAEASALGAAETLTFGAAGSNHALATSVYARALGLRPIAMLTPQPNAAYVRKNLLAHVALGTELHSFADGESRERAVVRLLREREEATGRRPYVVPMGGTSPLGSLGFVDAALELARQVSDGGIAVPDRLYVPLGSMGTAAGLIAGLHAAGLPTRVVAVRVTPREWADDEALARLVSAIVGLLRENGAEVEDVPASAFEVRHDAFGEGYAQFTPEGAAAVDAAAEGGLALEGTYSGKTMGVMLADLESGLADAEGAMFWDTYNSRDLARLCEGADARELPEALRPYFVEPLQELDR